MPDLEKRIAEIHALSIPMPLKKFMQQMELDIEHEAARITEMAPHYYRRLGTVVITAALRGGKLTIDDVAEIVHLISTTNAETLETLLETLEGLKTGMPKEKPLGDHPLKEDAVKTCDTGKEAADVQPESNAA